MEQETTDLALKAPPSNRNGRGTRVAARRPRITITMKGQRATEGVELDAFELFIENFRKTLREFDRQRHGRKMGRQGVPDEVDAAASAFRLVEFRTGSGVAILEPPLAPEPEQAPLPEVDGETRSVTTLSALMDALDEGERLEPTVVSALEATRTSVGGDGTFAVRLKGRRKEAFIDANVTARLTALLEPPDKTVDGPLTLVGSLHLADVAVTALRVEVTGQDGVEWECTYPATLVESVKALLGQIVTVAGTGRRISPGKGRLKVETIAATPSLRQGELFTVEPVPMADVIARSGVTGPQGLDALVDPDWIDDEDADRFLELVLGDIDAD